MVGSDHGLSTADDPSAVPLVDRDVCSAGNFSVEPYTLTTETGNMTGVIHDGLAVGDPGEGIPGRLGRGDNTIEIAGVDIDDTSLWSYLTGHGNGVCGSPTSKSDLTNCLDSWDATDGPLFESDLTDAVRLAWVPIFWENDLGNGTSDRTIREFRPVYLQTTMWKCKANSCKYIHEPGEGVTSGGGGGGSTQIEALSAIQIPFGALHADTQAIGPGSDGEKEYILLK
jgi:hypothetical protein